MTYNPSSPPHLVSSGFADILSTAPMLGSPDSGLCTDHLRPILSHDYSSAFMPPGGTGGPAPLSDQLGLRSIQPYSAPVIGDGRSQSRQSQSPTVSDSGIGMDSTSPGIGASNAPVSYPYLSEPFGSPHTAPPPRLHSTSTTISECDPG